MKEKNRLTQTLVFLKFSYIQFSSSHIYTVLIYIVLIYRQKYMVLNLLRITDGKCSHITFSMPKAKTITQIRPDDQNKGKGKAQSHRQ